MGRPAKKNVALTEAQWEIVLLAMKRYDKDSFNPNYRKEIKTVSADIQAKVGEPCGYCGSLSGRSEGADGWPRCNQCQGC